MNASVVESDEGTSVQVNMTKDESFDLRLELRGALSFCEKVGIIKPGEDGPNIRRLIQLLEQTR